MRSAVVAIAALAALALAALSCRDVTGGSYSTGLTGTVVRGPIMPVCRVDLPCDAPFAAHFTVRQGNRDVAAFSSDSTGAFEVRLAPGDYAVVPAADAPILSPAAQAKAVTVGPTGLTVAHLSFDTGIR